MNVNPDRFEAALRRLSAFQPPSAPTSIEQNVWRRIRQIVGESLDWRPPFWPQWVTNPAFGTGLIAACAAIGVFLSTALESRESALVRDYPGFSLSVFSDRAPGMIKLGGSE